MEHYVYKRLSIFFFFCNVAFLCLLQNFLALVLPRGCLPPLPVATSFADEVLKVAHHQK